MYLLCGSVDNGGAEMRIADKGKPEMALLVILTLIGGAAVGVALWVFLDVSWGCAAFGGIISSMIGFVLGISPKVLE